MRLHLMAAAALFFLVHGAFGQQSVPSRSSAPVSPKDPAQCAAFRAKLDSQLAEISSEHEACLDSYKADRQGDNNMVCSRSECQSLHTLLYGPSKAQGDQQVASCEAAVQRYQARSAAEQDGVQTLGDAISSALAVPDAAPLDSQGDLTSFEQQSRNQPVLGDGSSSLPSEDSSATAYMRATADSDPIAAQLDNAIDQAMAKGPDQNPHIPEIGDFPNLDKSQLGETKEIAANSPPDCAGSQTGCDGSSASKSDETDTDKILDKGKDVAVDLIKTTLDKGDAENFGKGVKTWKYVQDVQKLDPTDPSSAKDLVKDVGGDAFSYGLKKAVPPAAEVLEGPIGWIWSITFDSSSTQTPDQDIDPVSVMYNQGSYTFQQRQVALAALQQNAQKHPELWNPARIQWLKTMVWQVYSSPDNPNIHLGPPSQ
jgi:hypothetical protein